MSKVKPLFLILFVSASILLGTILTLTGEPPDLASIASIHSETGAIETAVVDDIIQREYRVTWQPQTVLESVPAAYHAPNRSQNLRSYFTPEGVYVVPRQTDAPDWQWGLHLVAYGSNAKRTPVAAAKLQAESNRIHYQRGEITEWYVNDARGLEQGFTIQSPLLESAVLHLDMAISGSLTPAMLEAEQAILFLDGTGAPVLRYSDLYAFDARQKDLPARMDLVTLEDGQQAIRLTVDATGAAYPITIDPVTSSPAWTASIAQSARFGTAVDSAGDVNGDGYDDVIVGASWYDNGQVDEGAAFVYLGSASGLGTGPGWMVESNTTQAEMGSAVSSAGDVNGDGYDDVIVGAHRYGNEQGAAYVYLGGPFGPSSTVDWFKAETASNSNLGYAVGSAGDVNRDGYDEIIVGAPNYGSANGRVYVYYGDPDGLQEPPWIADGNDPGMRFGSAVSGAGDVNNDTFDDVIIGAPDYLADAGFAPGLAVVFHGGASGLLDRGRPSLATEANWFQPGQLQNGMRFGFDVSTVGDVNDDGFADVIVGAPDYDAGEVAGYAAVYYGGSNGLIEGSPDWSMEGGPGSFFGTSVDTAGDVNGDGIDDVIVGSPNEDDSDCSGGQGDEGKAFLYAGLSIDGLDIVPFVTVGECQMGSKFGHDVAAAGDVNGDDYDDFLVGAPEFVTAASWRGQAFGYYGSGPLSGLTATNNSPQAINAPVTFNAQLQEGGYALYDWTFGDGQAGAGASTTHAYAMAGVYTATVVATNEYGSLTSTTSVTITTNSLIDPQNGGGLSFTDPQGRGTTVNVPPGAVNGPVSLNYTPLKMISQPKPPGTIDYYFDLDVEDPITVYLPVILNSSAGNAVETAVSTPDSSASIASIACNPGDFCFLVPISITITYNESLLTVPEDTLRLMFWDEDLQDWFDAATTCSPTSIYQRDLANNQFTVAVCHLTRFGVIGAN